MIIIAVLFAFNKSKDSKLDKNNKTIDLINDPNTPLDISGYIITGNNSYMYIIKGISYESKDNDIIGKTLIKQYEVKLLINDEMITTHSYNLDNSKALDDAIDNLTFSGETKDNFQKDSRIKIQIKYTTINNEKGITETDLYT